MTDIDDPTQPDGLTAVLLELDGLTGRLSKVAHQQEGDARQIRDRLAALAAALEQTRAAVDGHSEALTALDGLGERVTNLAARMDKAKPADTSDGGAGYRPSASPRFWKPDDPAMGEAVGKLRAWVEQVYRPGYGHLAAGLGECWDQHPLCQYVLDWLSELWSVLYLAPRRTQAILAGQAEWHARLLPAAAEQLARETRSCPRHAGPGRTLRAETRP